MQPRIALYTFGQFRLPADDPANDGFHARNDANLAAAEAADGFMARSGYADEPGPDVWGEQVYPRFHVERGDGWAPSTLSLWRDLASPMAFAYAGIHAEAMRHGRDWFDKPAWPPLVLWWVAGDHTPEWAEAVIRHEHLHDHGPSVHAFTFKAPFDANGHRCQVDREAVKRLMRANADRHAAAGRASAEISA
ncbi:DUF3291 domain-containing protein [Breoghania sp. L-A4]|uniref:DUF3291 domain-containing protein n=1 Tax=Breoghania sp. L-A4 TaxID=2304600 RepID=UPI000E35A77F|nr:DUF3291 domain-containing protein [Breoghania sp. L-A4]AXS40615.1 DUF3291 domain-containing protein [Breoghania sp. L-A4]